MRGYGERRWAPLGLLAPLASLGVILIIVGADDGAALQVVGAVLVVAYVAFAVTVVRRHRP